jgi:hypothetical protein
MNTADYAIKTMTSRFKYLIGPKREFLSFSKGAANIWKKANQHK